MPQYVVVDAPSTAQGAERMRIPLCEQVSRCLDDWDVLSTSSDDSDDFCGWRVGSRALPLPGNTQAAHPNISSLQGRPAEASSAQRASGRHEGSSSTSGAGNMSGTLLEARVRAMRATRAAVDPKDDTVVLRRQPGR